MHFSFINSLRFVIFEKIGRQSFELMIKDLVTLKLVLSFWLCYDMLISFWLCYTRLGRN